MQFQLNSRVVNIKTIRFIVQPEQCANVKRCLCASNEFEEMLKHCDD